MNTSRYKTPRALEMAVKAAAKKSSLDVNKALNDYYQGRFVERIFSERNPSFVLKGARGMFARYVDARRSRDSDFLYTGTNLDDAIAHLKRIAAIDLGDFLEFRFVSTSPIVEDQDYREGVRLTFAPVLGGTKKLNDISIDLVLDRVFSSDPDVVSPVNRLDIDGLPVFDYLVVPIVNSVCDKVCATLQVGKNGRESSRVRDLADLVSYLMKEQIDANTLWKLLAEEARLKHVGLPSEFSVPSSWVSHLSQQYGKIAKEAHLPDSLYEVGNAEAFVKKCIDPVLAGTAAGKTWNPDALTWEASV